MSTTHSSTRPSANGLNPADSNLAEQSIGAIVAADYRTAAVLTQYGIDFCCGGQLSLTEASQRAGADLNTLLAELAAASTTPVTRDQDYSRWSLTFLIDHIVATHHHYVDDNMAPIRTLTQKIARVHGERHPELTDIAALFETIATDLTSHLREEEETCFPAIKRIETSHLEGVAANSADIATLQRSLDNLYSEHEAVGEMIHRLRHLSRDFAVPADGCATYQLTYRKLEEFEGDLHKHIHLENNILFTKAEALISGS